MAVNFPVFRRKFPLLVTGGLLAIQPLASVTAAPGEQFACQPSASGSWNCAPQQSATSVPRPQHSATAVSAGASTAAATKGETSGSSSAASTEEPQQLVTQSGGRGLKSRSTDYSHLDWVPREKLTAAQLAEMGPYCSGEYVEPIRPGMNDKTPNDEAPTYVSAKVSRYEQEKQVATLAGNVVLRQGSMQVEADEANLHQAENRGELVGNVKLRDNGALIVGDHAELQLDNGAAKIDNAEYVMHQAQVRGSALYAKRQEDAIIQLKDGTYTRCEPSSNAWVLKGNNIKLNPATGFGTATNATLRVKDIPVFYTPYIYFPIDNRRQSGFLPPSFATTTDTGFTLTTPYYFNLAPNYDATLYPKYMVKRGLLMEGEFRYLTHSSEGQFNAAYLNDKDDDRKGFPQYTDTRWLYGWKNVSGLDSRVLAQVDYTRISDPYYFQDLDTSLGINAPTYVNQQGSLTYRGDSYTARLNAQAYQLANVTDVTPYDRLPQLTLNGALPFNPGGAQFTYGTEAVRFDRDLDETVYLNDDGTIKGTRPDANIKGLARATGDRFHAEPGVSLPMNRSWGFMTPTLKGLYTKYDLDLDGQGKQYIANNQPWINYESSPDRALTLAKLDSGLYFDRDTSFGGSKFRQTLEPRAMYLYVPYKNQDNLPTFDTGEFTFSYDSLWRENRFTGKDRIGDANQLSLGLGSRFIDDSGFERAYIAAGQIYYFSDRRVQLPGLTENDLRVSGQENPDADTWRSPYALTGLYRFNHDWSASSDFNWNADTHHTNNGNLMFHYQPEADPRKILNAGYRYRADTKSYNPNTGNFQYNSDVNKINQHDFSFMWPVLSQWAAIGRWQFDYNQSRTLEAFGGFEYDSCCWKLRLINRYWVNYDDENYLSSSDTSKSDHGVFLQIILKGLGGVVGNQVEGFLDQGIQGYRQREDNAM
ncbi:LPS-assembly protein LptD [Pseudomonas sp. LA21]|uniref:LPS-assembly protein LptD n=1 Tax=unclassified Pseudomonas TaxID=196821 RepID=UPI001FB6522F|nr:LPS-assembly protein LptD [Pseudomonas sp. LA21]MCJ1886705.1 LPS-assembly protein LptD [Pseudomonas sp. LA21]